MDPAKLKVVELRSELSKRGLDTKGNKAVLVERLRQALEGEPETHHEEKSENESGASEDESNKNARRVKEKTPESSRPPPRTPSRATRNAAAVAAAVVAPKTPTRSTQRASAAVTKQQSPNKSQDKPNETVPTAEEPPVKKPKFEEKPTTTSPSSITTPEKSPRKIEESPLKSSSEETDNSMVSPKKPQSESVNILEEDITKSPKSMQESSTESAVTTVTEDDNVNKLLEKQQESPGKTVIKSHESPEKHSTEMKTHTETESVITLPVQQSPTKSLIHAEPAEDSVIESVSEDSTKESEIICTKQEPLLTEIDTDSQAVQKHEDEKNDDEYNLTNVPKVEATIPLQKACQDESEEITEKNVNQEQNARDGIEENVTEKIEEEVEDKSSEEVKEELQDVDVDMKEIKESVQDTVKCNVKPEQNDRKRKRSASPQEDSVPSVRLEPDDEPELDNSSVLLSWYDSDLNLVIDKSNFVSATPMYNEGFGYMWAGARASFGFNSGKVFYETKVTKHCSIELHDEPYPHVVRIGWSVIGTSMQLGEERLSYGYEGTRKKSTECKFEDYGVEFSQGDIISSYLDATDENNVTISYAVNGKHLGTAFTIEKQDLQDKALFPHVLSKNCMFTCNFGQEDRWSEENVEGYTFVGLVDLENRIQGPQRPEKKEDCEVIMMCGLPGSGKTTWCSKYAAEHLDKMYNMLGTHFLIEKMKIMGQPRKQTYSGRWEVLLSMCTRALNVLLDKAYTRRRNYILDQTNVYPSAQKRKVRTFAGFRKKAVVIVPTDEEFKERSRKHEAVNGKEVPDSAILEMKANFNPPSAGEIFDTVEWPELNEQEARKLIEQYSKEGRTAGFGSQSQPQNKRARTDNQKDNRDSRNNRDSHRRGGYSDRGRGTSWRGGSSSGGWRDNRASRGGHMRHGSFGGSGGWRPRGPMSAHRGGDRRGGSDRRPGNDRLRSVQSRSGGWGQSGYQGQQSSGNWNNQGAWSGGQSQGGWNQSNWGNSQWGNWKSYGQGNYNNSNYNQQSYDNGNYSGWNQQYYNQYWGQPQQSGQTTAAGSQAVTRAKNVTADRTISNTTSSYSYEDWQNYSQTRAYPDENYSTSN